MCIICVEYEKGKLTGFEALRNAREFPLEEQAHVEARVHQDIADDIAKILEAVLDQDYADIFNKISRVDEGIDDDEDTK